MSILVSRYCATIIANNPLILIDNFCWKNHLKRFYVPAIVVGTLVPTTIVGTAAPKKVVVTAAK